MSIYQNRLTEIKINVFKRLTEKSQVYLEQDLANVAHILNVLVELVELQESQIRFQIVANLFGLNINVSKNTD